MKIMLAHSRYRSSAPSGENLVVDQEAQELAGSGHNVTVFERRSDDIESWSLLRRATVPTRIARNGRVRAELRDMLRDWKPDVLHVHNTFPLLSPSVLLAARDADVPVVATIHNYKLLCASGDFFRDGKACHDCSNGQLFASIRHGCYRGSRAATVPVTLGLAANRQLWRDMVSAYIFISAAQRDLMTALDLPRHRVFVKHNFVQEAEQPPVGRRRHGISYVGRLDDAKGTRVLMNAWSLFRAEHPRSSLSLTIAGTGPLADQVRSWAAGQDHVDYRGLVRRAEARAIVAGGLAAVVPSAWEETFGLVAVEAMAEGVAPVAPATGSFVELIEDGIDGILYPHGARGLASVFARLDADPARAVLLGKKAERSFRSRFHPMENLKQLVEIYDFAVSSPRFTDGLQAREVTR